MLFTFATVKGSLGLSQADERWGTSFQLRSVGSNMILLWQRKAKDGDVRGRRRHLHRTEGGTTQAKHAEGEEGLEADLFLAGTKQGAKKNAEQKRDMALTGVGKVERDKIRLRGASLDGSGMAGGRSLSHKIIFTMVFRSVGLLR